MTPDDAAAQAVRAVPGEGPAARATRLAVAHVLALDDGDERERWRDLLARCEALLLDGREDTPRPGMTDLAIVQALRRAEADAGLTRPPVIDGLRARENRNS
jgi:hypothetical protein